MFRRLRGETVARAAWGLYSRPVRQGWLKLSLQHEEPQYDWMTLAARLAGFTGYPPELRFQDTHTVIALRSSEEAARSYLRAHAPEVRWLGAGMHLELYGGIGAAGEVAERFGLSGRSGTHCLGHGRMSPTSGVITAEASPFSKGLDLCLVHDGPLRDRHRLRSRLRADGFELSTNSDSEAAAACLSWAMQSGSTLEEALQRALPELLGFGTFAVATRDALAVLRDQRDGGAFVLAETDAYVALAAECEALVDLPGIGEAHLWNPKPGRVYCWSRAAEVIDDEATYHVAD